MLQSHIKLEYMCSKNVYTIRDAAGYCISSIVGSFVFCSLLIHIYSNLGLSKFPSWSNLILFDCDITPIPSVGFACSFLFRVPVSGMVLGSFSLLLFILSSYGIFCLRFCTTLVAGGKDVDGSSH
jgi:hypothetical protein